MRETLREEVSVNLVFDHKRKRVTPRHLKWQGRLCIITQVGLHHTYRRGRTLFHVFSVTDGTTFFRLELDTETLHWILTEVSDGQPD
jgi:hypothetical protein